MFTPFPFRNHLDKESFLQMYHNPTFAPFWVGLLSTVETFFLLTGFLLTVGLLQSQKSYYEYLKSRLIRIYPLLLTAVILEIIFPVHIAGLFSTATHWKTLTFTQNIYSLFPSWLNQPIGER